jgi:hypothetical protein
MFLLVIVRRPEQFLVLQLHQPALTHPRVAFVPGVCCASVLPGIDQPEQV